LFNLVLLLIVLSILTLLFVDFFCIRGIGLIKLLIDFNAVVINAITAVIGIRFLTTVHFSVVTSLVYSIRCAPLRLLKYREIVDVFLAQIAACR